MTKRKSLLNFILLAGLVGLLLMLSSSTAMEQRAAAPMPGSENEQTDNPIVGAERCIGCHLRPEGTPFKRAPELIRLDESSIWQNYDLHRHAFDALKDKRAAQMEGILRKPSKKDAAWTVAKEPACLTCHSVDLELGKSLHQKTEKMFYTEFGVSCETCHGFATKWDLPHSAISWREKTPHDKEALGQWDLRNPARRAERCTSCHVGNLGEGRFVTHEMYAAGHPPLPAIEVMSYSRDQRMHYKFGKDSTFITDLAEKEPEKAWQLYHYRKDESQPTRQVAVGALMTFRAAVELIAHEAEECAKENKGRNLDFAQFDCYACHHDLKTDSDRQRRGFAGTPGRPQLKPGVVALARIVSAHAASIEMKSAQLNIDHFKQFDAELRKLTTEFDRKVFGDAVAVQSASKGLLAWIDRTVIELDKVPYSQAESARLLQVIVKSIRDEQNPWLDPDSAQQLVWAAEVLRSEIEGGSGPIEKYIAQHPLHFPLRVRDTSKVDWVVHQLGARLDRIGSFKLDEFRKEFEGFDQTKPPK